MEVVKRLIKKESHITVTCAPTVIASPERYLFGTAR